MARTSRLNRRSIKLLAAVSLGLLASGVYLALLVVSPSLPPRLTGRESTTSMAGQTATIGGDRLYIPRLGLSLPYATGGPEVLASGAWHRYPERGDPAHGGNFILAGHRFRLAATPNATIDSSPFYHIDRLGIGDKIYVDFDGQRYEYSVTKHYTVAPTEVQIEASSSTPKMTLYTCSLAGSSDGREVIIAKLIAKAISPIQPLQTD